MNGKQKCRILKDIRRQIALENDIDLVIEACTHKGACRGTCPRCEAEVRYLERELEKRRALQKRIALVGISAGMTLALSGCGVVDRVTEAARTAAAGQSGIEELSGAVDVRETLPPEEIDVLDGEVAVIDMQGANDAAPDMDDPLELESTTTGMVAPLAGG
ncbi:MAG: hypothetical protein IJH38_07265 [Clostridia bacterium]|nr:hypothetical protein [Clostridia bacterium]